MKKVYFENLDALRFFAFFIVYIYHGFGEYLKTFGISVALFGGMGVSIFFVLSGFLISYFLFQELENKKSIDLKSFYIRRICRTWPLYFLVISLAFLILFWLGPMFFGTQPTNSNPFYFFVFLGNIDVIHTQNHFFGNDSLITNNTWSLAVEEQFYLVWPIIFLFIKRSFIPFVFAISFILSLCFRIYNASDPTTIYFHTFSVFFDLVFGGCIAYLICFKIRFRSWIENMDIKSQLLFLIILALPILAGAKFPILKFNGVFGRYFFILFFGFIILNQCFTKDKFLILSKLPFVSWLGKLSYGLYLYHTVALILCQILCLKYFGQNANSLLLSGIIALPLTVVTSYLSFTYFESYFLKLKERLSK